MEITRSQIKEAVKDHPILGVEPDIGDLTIEEVSATPEAVARYIGVYVDFLNGAPLDVSPSGRSLEEGDTYVRVYRYIEGGSDDLPPANLRTKVIIDIRTY